MCAIFHVAFSFYAVISQLTWAHSYALIRRFDFRIRNMYWHYAAWKIHIFLTSLYKLFNNFFCMSYSRSFSVRFSILICSQKHKSFPCIRTLMLYAQVVKNQFPQRVTIHIRSIVWFLFFTLTWQMNQIQYKFNI